MSKARRALLAVASAALGVFRQLGRPRTGSAFLPAIVTTIGVVALSPVLLPNSMAAAMGLDRLLELPGLIAEAIASGMNKVAGSGGGGSNGSNTGDERLSALVQGIVQALNLSGSPGGTDDPGSGALPNGDRASGAGVSGGNGVRQSGARGVTGSGGRTSNASNASDATGPNPSATASTGGGSESGSIDASGPEGSQGGGGGTESALLLSAPSGSPGGQSFGSSGSPIGPSSFGGSGTPGNTGPAGGAAGPGSPSSDGATLLDPDDSADATAIDDPLGDMDSSDSPLGSLGPDPTPADGASPEEPSDPVVRILGIDALPDGLAATADIGITQVPQPSTLLLLTGALTGMAALGWRKRAK